MLSSHESWRFKIKKKSSFSLSLSRDHEHSRRKETMSTSAPINALRLLFIVLLITLLICSWTQYGYVYAIVRNTSSCANFYEWICMLKGMNLAYERSGYLQEPEEPHFILVNHIGGLGVESFISLSGIITNSCRIVCNRKYVNSKTWFIGSVMDQLLDQEIRVDNQHPDPQEKERSMTRGIEETFANNQNVVMFIDAYAYGSPMRSLNKQVLSQFPNRIKHLFHLSHMRDGVHIMHAFQPTRNLDQILEIRTHLVSTSKT